MKKNEKEGERNEIVENEVKHFHKSGVFGAGLVFVLQSLAVKK